ncbi:hypothetical protein [Zavarzinella formosa]|uniref:hypothetical protein n=1 Tax=Zavarzinella formosa TaxID=360055 RepID=UPI0002E7DD2F|nr:hypothetical protein [Zavarzinella formosa]
MLPNAQVQLPAPENPRPFHRDTGRRSTATTCSARNLVLSTGDRHRAKCFVFHPSQPASASGTDDFTRYPTNRLALSESKPMPPNNQVQRTAFNDLSQAPMAEGRVRCNAWFGVA